jgi:hypothetical protein
MSRFRHAAIRRPGGKVARAAGRVACGDTAIAFADDPAGHKIEPIARP